MTDKPLPERDYRRALLRDENTLRFLRLMIGLMLGSSVAYLAAALIVSDESLLRSAGAGAAFLSASIAYGLIRQGRLEAGVRLLVWGAWLSVVLQVVLSNGLMSRSLMAFPIIIMLGGWLLPPRGVVAVCLATLLAGATLALGEQAGVLPLRMSPSPPPLIWLAFVIYTGLSATLAYFVFRGFRRHHKSMQRLGANLQTQLNALSTREAELHLVMESVPVMLFHGDRDKRCLYANRNYADFYAAHREDLTGLTVREIIGAENYDDNAVDATLDRVLAGERIAYRTSRKSSSGVVRMLDIVMIPEPDADGGTRGFFAQFRDVTEEVRAEEALRSSEEKFARVFQANPVAISISRLRDGLYLDVNEAFGEQFGWRRDEMIGRTALEIGLWPSPIERARWVADLNRTGRVRNRLTALRTKSGARHSVLVSAERILLKGEECIVGMVHDITDRLQAEAALRESEERLRLATAGGGVGIWEWDIASGALAWNDQLKHIFGLPADTAGLTLEGFVAAIHPEDRDRVQRSFRAALEQHGEFDAEYRIVRPDGGVSWIVARGHGVYDGDGQATRMVGMAIDTTERKRAEEKFAKIFHASPVAISISRLSDGFYLDVNDAFVEQFGWSREEFIGRNALEVGVWPSREERDRWVAELQKTSRVRHFEVRLNTKSGDSRIVLVSAEKILFEGDECVIGMVYDITERKQAEEARRHSEDKFSRVFQASPIAISLARFADGTFADANPAFVRIFGWTREELIGRSSTEIGLWPSVAERDRWREVLRRSGQMREFVVRWHNKAGETRSCRISAETLDIGGEPYILAMTSDITDSVRAEEALKTSQARLAEAQRIGHFGSWDLDLASKRIYWSDELFNIYEVGPAAFAGTWDALLESVHPDDRNAIRRVFRESVNANTPYEVSHRIVTPGGRIKHLRVRWEVFFDAEGKPVRALGTAQDITEQVLAREEVQRLNDELEARVQARTAELTAANRELESFAYSISHDLRAPLRGIDGFSHLLAEEYANKLDATGRDYLERVRRAAQRMGELIDDILELSRVTRQEMRRVRVDLSRIAAEVIDERARSEPDRKVELSIAPECIALGDPQLLRVLLQNLLENAWKYGRKADPARIAFGRETLDGETVFFVRDNGVGFDMQYADRLFSPFQRLHKPEEFEGTGIGLATVARVVHRHGGRVWAQAETGKGATFRFTLGRGREG